jgi:hypothetical protein
MILGSEVKKDKVIIHKGENVEQQAKVNYMLRNAENNGFSKDRMWRNTMNLTNSDFYKAVQKYPDIMPNCNHPATQEDVKKAWRKVFYDPEFYHCRAVEGGV